MPRLAVLMLALLTLAPHAMAVLTPKIFAEDSQEGIIADVRAWAEIHATGRPFSPLEGSCTYDLAARASVEGGYMFGGFSNFRYEWWAGDEFDVTDEHFYGGDSHEWEVSVPLGTMLEQTYSAGGVMIVANAVAEQVEALAIVRLACPLDPIG